MTTRDRLIAHEPALDGMRALAVIAVLLYHGHVSWMRGGFLGVDAFFVLSGYLITSLLVAEWQARGTIDLKAFWARRARRLLPALLLLVLAVSAYAAWAAPAGELNSLRADALATLGYVANWREVAVGSNYGDLFTAPSPLQHAWSLGIEEQWYLLWPLAVAALLWISRRARHAPLVTVAVLAGGSAALMAVLYDPQHLGRVYYGTDTRCQSLLIGAGLALAFGHARPYGRTLTSATALSVAAAGAVIVLATTWATTPLDAGWLYRGGILGCALLVAIVIAAATRRGPIRSALSMPPLPQIGLISYGLYLWHWPVYVVLSSNRTGIDGWALLALRLAVTSVVATASFFVVERPIRTATLHLPRPRLTAPAVVLGVAAVALLATNGGHPSVVFIATPSAPPTTSAPSVPASPVKDPVPTQHAQTRVAVVGDSVALVMGEGLMRVGPSFGLDVWDQGVLGCGLLRGTMWIEGAVHDVAATCTGWPTRFRDIVDEWAPQVVVLLTGAWDAYDVRLDGQWVPFGTPRYDAFALEEVQHAVDVLESRGAKVVVLTSPYFQARRDIVDADRTAYNPKRVDHLNELFRRLRGVSLLDLNRFLAPDGHYTNDVLDVADVRGDGVHFTPAGADLVARWLAPQLESLVDCGQTTRNCSIATATSDGRS
ncbi:MAG TPA: acyltransferase family protein [Acidimicrobiales bacterium]|nr:acyltransferase family protein [Acidimicrobiales bacterium]